MSIKIITDSTADIPESVKSKVTVIPLTVKFGEEEYIDGVNISKEEFYTKLKKSKVLPTTSQPSPQMFKEKYEQMIKEGHSVLVITISSTLSGTYQTAVLASEGLSDKVFVVDSGNGSIAEGILVELALRLVEEGKSIEEIKQILETEKERIIIVAILNTFDYLVKGGRMSKASAFIGNILSLKVLFTVIDGKVVPVGKARGLKNAKNILNEYIEKTGGIDFDKPYMAGYTGNDTKEIKTYIGETKHIWSDALEEHEPVCIGSVIGTHAGPDGMAVVFFKNKN